MTDHGGPRASLFLKSTAVIEGVERCGKQGVWETDVGDFPRPGLSCDVLQKGRRAMLTARAWEPESLSSDSGSVPAV